MERRIIKRWSSLSWEEKKNQDYWAKKIFEYLAAHPNKELPWEAVNRHVKHIYRFQINNYNKTHDTVIDWSDTGIILYSNIIGGEE